MLSVTKQIQSIYQISLLLMSNFTSVESSFTLTIIILLQDREIVMVSYITEILLEDYKKFYADEDKSRLAFLK